MSFRVNGRCEVNADGVVSLNSEHYRVHPDGTIEIAEYHDDGSIDHYEQNFERLSADAVNVLLERAALARQMAAERRTGAV